MEKNNNLMSGKGEKGKWITVNGSHVFIEDGQSVEDAMNKHFDKKINIDESINWEEKPLTGDAARFNKFLNMIDKNLSTEELRNELKSVGLNEDGISAVWNTDSLYSSDKKEMGRDLMSIFNKAEYRQDNNHKNNNSSIMSWSNVKTIKQAKKLDPDIVEKIGLKYYF